MIQVFKPKIRSEEILLNLADIFNNGWIGLGPKTKQFEDKICNFLNCGNFIATNSCTSSLHLAIRSLDLPKNSKILTTPISFVSTNSAILYENHLPVFCDVEETTGNIKADSIENFLKQDESIRALIVVHIGGYSCDMDKINALAKKYNIKIIEDCAHAFGATYNDKMIGDTENICVWSFQAVKNLPVGDGGGISTKDNEIASKIRKLIWLGIDKTTINRSNLDSKNQSYNWDYEVVDLGYKYHMNDISATIGLTQFKYILEDNKRREQIANRYKLEIINPNCTKPNYESNRKSSYHFYPLFFNNRNEIYKKLTDKNIYPGMHYKRNDNYSIFKKYFNPNLIGVEKFEKSELTLPIHLHLSDDDISNIIRIINE